jgi:indolepyruvate ferredoxin oxidoreductase
VPEHIRGYGHVKLRHLAQAKAQETKLLAAFRSPSPVVTAAE